MGGGAGIPVGLDVRLDVVDFFEYMDSGVRGTVNFFGHLLDDDICSYAPQMGGGHNFIPRRTLVDGQVGLYYVCEYCGKAYGDALEEAYQDYVETLPGKAVNSNGAFLWTPTFDNFDSPYISVFLDNASPGWFTPEQLSFSVSQNGVSRFFSLSVCDSVSCFYTGWSYSFSFFVRWPAIKFLPCDGVYTSVNGVYAGSFSRSLSASDSIPLGYSPAKSLPSGAFNDVVALWPQFWITPISGLSGVSPSFSADTRVSGAFGSSSVDNSGLYGYVQDGQLYQSTVGTIYNETSNIYQNPVTGDTSNISSWQYDYSDRSYTLTTDEGDNVTVTYGDTNVTINEGGTTYNVYYLMEETADIADEVRSSCDHEYTSTVTTAPTCTASGVRTYTCSECGASYTEAIPATGHDYQSAVTMEPTCVSTGVTTFVCSRCGSSYTQTIPATGHIWEVVRSVPTQYDDTGQLVQSGYTLYQCATCGEQYKITSDSGGDALPVPSSGGVSTGGSELVASNDVGEGFLASIAGGLSNDLPAVMQMMSDWFTLVPQMFSGYAGFLTAGFAWLPSDCLMLLSFGVGSVVFIGIVKAIRRR